MKIAKREVLVANWCFVDVHVQLLIIEGLNDEKGLKDRSKVQTLVDDALSLTSASVNNVNSPI